MEKILITGTGRCGTTFLIKLFSFLDFDTGFSRDNYEKSIFKNCNSGMEKKYTDNFYIVKNPTFMTDIDHIIKNKEIIIKTVIIPIRNYKDAAISRVKNSKYGGGLWNATDEKTQIIHYKNIISEYIYYMTKYEINTIFLDFDKMVNDHKYLFLKLKTIIDEKNINLETFAEVYSEVSLTSRVNSST